jgi:hypothetical protein
VVGRMAAAWMARAMKVVAVSFQGYEESARMAGGTPAPRLETGDAVRAVDRRGVGDTGRRRAAVGGGRWFRGRGVAVSFRVAPMGATGAGGAGGAGGAAPLAGPGVRAEELGAPVARAGWRPWGKCSMRRGASEGVVSRLFPSHPVISRHEFPGGRCRWPAGRRPHGRGGVWGGTRRSARGRSARSAMSRKRAPAWCGFWRGTCVQYSGDGWARQ